MPYPIAAILFLLARLAFFLFVARKLLERHQPNVSWNEQYRVLEVQSEQVRRTAHVIFQNLLG